MRYWISSFLVLGFCATPALAGAKTLLDLWETAYLGDGKAGYIHTQAREITIDGKKSIRTSVEVRLKVKRFDGMMEMAADTGTTEDPDGNVTATSMKLFLAQKQTTQIEGVVDGKQIKLILNGREALKPAPWNPEVLGLYKQENLFKGRDLKPGSKFSFLTFEPTINLVMKMEVIVRGEREVTLFGSKKKERLLLVEVVPDKIEYKQGQKVQLPAKQMWLNDKLEAVRTETDIPGMGPIVTYRVSQAQALAPGPVAELVDLGFNQLIRLKNRILNPHETTGAVYRVSIRNDDDPGSAFSRDERQQVKNLRGNTFELHVTTITADSGPGKEKAPPEEFLQSSFFITSDSPKVRELTWEAIGKETNPWKKVVRIERWVNMNMRFANDESLATADHVARTLQGDCTEFSMLTAAMCRAAGIPSRTAIGLIYADVKKEPVFAFHMWTEVFVNGRWIPIDATLGKGYVGAAHLKITDHSWHDERTMTPIFPVVRVVGRVSIDVLSAASR